MVSSAQFARGYSLLEALLAAGLIASKSEGRRHLVANAVRLNNAAIVADRALGSADLDEGAIKLSIGKKKHALLKIGG
jgi:tyrosyl-tRNA synthetase